jgi:hypothetical protein
VITQFFPSLPRTTIKCVQVSSSLQASPSNVQISDSDDVSHLILHYEEAMIQPHITKYSEQSSYQLVELPMQDFELFMVLQLLKPHKGINSTKGTN